MNQCTKLVRGVWREKCDVDRAPWENFAVSGARGSGQSVQEVKLVLTGVQGAWRSTVSRESEGEPLRGPSAIWEGSAHQPHRRSCVPSE